jgi:hypothetical protein
VPFIDSETDVVPFAIFGKIGITDEDVFVLTNFVLLLRREEAGDEIVLELVSSLFASLGFGIGKVDSGYDLTPPVWLISNPSV